MVRPSGLKATLSTGAECSRVATRAAGLGVVEPGQAATGRGGPGRPARHGSGARIGIARQLLLVAAAAHDHAFPVRAERQRHHRHGTAPFPDRAQVTHIPEPDLTVPAAGGQRTAVGPEGDRVDQGVQGQGAHEQLPGGDVPEPDLALVGAQGFGPAAAADHGLAVRAERQRHHGERMRLGHADVLARAGIPEPGHGIVAAGQHGRAVRAERDGLHRIGVHQGPALGLAGGGVPELGNAPDALAAAVDQSATGDDERAVRTDGRGLDGTREQQRGAARAPVRASQRSSTPVPAGVWPAVKNQEPAGLKARASRRYASAFAARTALSVAVSQSWMVPSWLPVKARRPSGLKATPTTGPGWSVGVPTGFQPSGSQSLASPGPAWPHFEIPGPREQVTAVGTEGDRHGGGTLARTGAGDQEPAGPGREVRPDGRRQFVGADRLGTLQALRQPGQSGGHFATLAEAQRPVDDQPGIARVRHSCGPRALGLRRALGGRQGLGLEAVAHRHAQEPSTPAKPTSTTKHSTPIIPASAGLRRLQRRRPPGEPHRPRRIGSWSRNRRRSSARSQDVGYRSRGSFSRHFMQMVTRSWGTRGWSRRTETGTSCATCKRVSSGEAELKGGRPVSSS